MVEQRERRMTAYLSALLAAGRDVDMWVALEDERVKFDEMLAADPLALPDGMDEDELELRRILGVA